MRTILSCGVAASVWLTPAYAQSTLPTGATVVGGSVNIAQPGPRTMVINQSSESAVVNWNSFSIGSESHVDIRQPGAQSSILNRVTGNTRSDIHGRLTANGQVHLVNPNGIFIGSNGTVDAGAFVASTLDISTEDFLAGRYRFQGNGSSATVSNAGRVRIGPDGYAALLGGRVRNSGIVTVPMGRIGFASGERVTLDLSGDQFLQVAIPTAGEDGGEALISHSGIASADGGLIEMRAATAREAVRQAINLSGVAEARSVSVRNGAIVLGGGSGGSVQVSGRVSTRQAGSPLAVASSPRPPRGPEITLTGREIILAGAEIDASAEEGGGLVRIGGDFSGAGDLLRALSVDVDSASVVRADAIGAGDGGRIAVWSDDQTRFDGTLSARGGEIGGDGGFIEVSSSRVLSYGGSADTRAGYGRWGTLLLDPLDITIDPGAGGETTLEADLERTNVFLDTFNSVVGDTGDIFINATLDWVATTTLFLRADNDIFLNGAINAPNGGIFLNATNNVATNAASAIDVASFTLSSGIWNQVGTLPSFSATNFQAACCGTFLRALGGDGSAASPYQITDVYGLQGLATPGLSGANAVLANDVDASGTSAWVNDFDGNGFEPIPLLGGTLDGAGFTVSGLFSSQFSFDEEFFGLRPAALINTIDSSGAVTDLTLENANIAGSSAAVLAVTNNGTVRNTRSSGNVSAALDAAGGLIAVNTGSVQDSLSSANVTVDVGSSSIPHAAGGFVGRNQGGTIARSHATGNVTVTNSVNLDTPSGIRAGGFVGETDAPAQIADSYSRGNVTVTDTSTGSLAGAFAGGFAGDNAGSLTRSYSTGMVTTSGALSFTTGGFLGRDTSSGGASANFWDVDISGRSTSPGATGLTTAQFQDTPTFIALGGPLGWDFGTIWAPGDTGFHPVNYSTSPVVFAQPDPLTVQYGQTEGAVATGSVAGGPGSYVFDGCCDTLGTSPIFQTLAFPDINVGSRTFTVDSTALTSADGISYRVVDLVGSATVTPAPLVVTADDATSPYGQAAVLGGFLTTGLLFADSVDSVTLTSAGSAADAGVNGGTPYAIAASDAVGTGLGNYDISYVDGALTVTPAPLVVTAEDATSPYGQAAVLGGFSTTGLLFADSVDSVTLTSAGSAADAGVNGGLPYAIVASDAAGTGLGNYDITYVDGALTVTPAPLVVTAEDATSPYGQAAV
ncbi:filamentous hemagglutinin N-terminal domain-containing protein, partial [Ruegeria marina]|uniref:two-partner secretion domain-containing protein n=1 Tax=Ruegeria marina TaxID=639004 RepID=UPI001FDF9AE9